jgi:hypothetical protein
MMSKILVDRVVLEQALEALDKLYLPGELERVNAAIIALRAELEQSDQKPLAVREGVHEINGERGSSETTSVAFQYRREQVAKQMAGVYTAFGASHIGDADETLIQRTALAQQEPVAWAKEYAAINEFYGKQTANRSRLLLMRHIDDGLHILALNGASDMAKAAFCLHPIVQNNEAVDVSWSSAYSLACEYRDKANAYLCRTDTDWISTAEDVQSVVGEMTDDCRAMLIADKRQNYGDFIATHYGKHARSKELDRYFRLWIAYLEGFTPPSREWKNLTDEEHLIVIDNTLEGGSILDVARAVETLLKDRNNT